MQEYLNAFLSVVEPYQQNHLLSIGAHIHHINVFASTSAAVPDISIVQFITPSVTPYYNNNPGYGILNIDDSSLTVQDFIFHFMQLEDYHRFKVVAFVEYDPAKLGGFDINDP